MGGVNNIELNYSNDIVIRDNGEAKNSRQTVVYGPGTVNDTTYNMDSEELKTVTVSDIDPNAKGNQRLNGLLINNYPLNKNVVIGSGGIGHGHNVSIPIAAILANIYKLESVDVTKKQGKPFLAIRVKEIGSLESKHYIIANFSRDSGLLELDSDLASHQTDVSPN